MQQSKNIFTSFYKNNKWKNKETKSGSGSTLNYTKELRSELPILIEKFKIKSILDAPCGDFNWMKEVLPNINVNYIGADIVPDIISDNNRNYNKENVKFIELDITKDKLPLVDLMVCRDCLFHLPNKHIFDFFKNFSNSGIKYLLTSTHYNNNEFKNRDIAIGQFRRIDLFTEPFNIPNNPLYRINDWIHPSFPREMVLLESKNILTN